MISMHSLVKMSNGDQRLGTNGLRLDGTTLEKQEVTVCQTEEGEGVQWCKTNFPLSSGVSLIASEFHEHFLEEKCGPKWQKKFVFVRDFMCFVCTKNVPISV